METTSDFYHHYREDIDIMSENHLGSFRFSIAWPRMFPNNPYDVNQEAIDYYNDMFSYLNEKGIIPFVDMFHWDMPMWVIERGGVANKEFVQWLVKKNSRANGILFALRICGWRILRQSTFTAIC